MVVCLAAPFVVLAGCTSPVFRSQDAVSSASALAPSGRNQPPPGPAGLSAPLTAEHVRQGLDLLHAGSYEAAAREFSVPLRYDPQNADLRFLNGLAQHLMAEHANPERYEYARIGYELALKFDPNHWPAAQQLARLSLEQRDYETAQDNFSRALLCHPADPALLYGLAQASYYLGDLPTAFAAIRRARELQPDSPEIVAAEALIAAAAAQPELAQQSLRKFRTMETGSARFAKLETRVGEWALVHRRDPAEAELITVAPADAAGGQPSRPAAATPTADSQMVMIDVVMIRTEENETSTKGLNLMENLTASFTGHYVPAQNRAPGGKRWEWGSVNLLTLTQGSSTNDLRYSLDIFNAGDDRTEVLAMPTLIALNGKPSSSFAGSTLNVSIKGVNTANLTAIDSGITLEVLPTFLPNGLLQLHVLVRRTFLEEGAVGSFQEAVRTSKNEVSADVILGFGQTLILGGLREKQTSGTKSGVPLLRDLPGVQYFFSREATTDFHKSLLFLLTPRRVTAGLYRSVADGEEPDAQSPPAERARVKEFQRRYGYIFAMEPNLERMMRHIDRHRVAQGIRSADFFDRPWWGSTESIDLLLQRATSFLLY